MDDLLGTTQIKSLRPLCLTDSLLPDGFASVPCFGQSRPCPSAYGYASTNLVSQDNRSSISLPRLLLPVHVYDVFAPSQCFYQRVCIRCGSAAHRTTLPYLYYLFRKHVQGRIIFSASDQAILLYRRIHFDISR